MNTPELVAKLKQAEKAIYNLKSAGDKRKREAGIDGVLAYVKSLRETLENEI